MLRYHTVALQSAVHQNEFAMFDRLPITAQIYIVRVWVADYVCRFNRKLSELSVLNFPRSISKRIFFSNRAFKDQCHL